MDKFDIFAAASFEYAIFEFSCDNSPIFRTNTISFSAIGP